MQKNITVLLSLAIVVLVFSCKESSKNIEAPSNTEQPMIQHTFNDEDTKEAHFAKAQYYRWYQLYERPMTEKRVANQLDLLAADVVVESAAGNTQGHAMYTEKIKIYEGWQNAHHVQNLQFKKDSTGTPQLLADIRYQNIKPNGEKAGYTIDYVIDLEKEGYGLKKMKKVIIKGTGSIDDPFEDAYAKNRAASLMHYYIANVEELNGDVTPFKELLAEDFQLHLAETTHLNSIDAMEKWLQAIAQQVKQGSHHPENFKVKELKDNEFELNVDFDWYGISQTDDKMTMKTRHTWKIIDNPNERFARIKEINVAYLVPLQKVQ